MQIKVIRFRKPCIYNVVAVYKKGKAGKLNTENIRFLLDDIDGWDNMKDGKWILAIPSHPNQDLLHHPMASGRCGMTGLPMIETPELAGDIAPCTFVDTSSVIPPQLRQKNYNYYLQTDQAEIDAVYGELVNEIPAIEHP